ncbi:hypothetical protein [Pseudoduganella namucuonensis]|uniref:Transporter n=1 Tax=Pseudoduganella namucuonensis TaxID=1035707 RepID=A0A1I7K203_9BURK|nr:hypothetical protein [Pseudoduganella namucuonensis]SFU91454.1 hypothetical protein SAMN05216552_101488 [Pseudoduganella namucuonensis]
MGTLLLKSLACVSALACCQALATEDSGTPGPGRWEINTGASLELLDGAGTLALPDTEVNYGIGEALQLTLAMPLVRLREDGARARSGWGSATAGAKWRLLEDEGGMSLALFPRFTWNPASSAARRGLASPGHSLLMPVIVGFSHGGSAVYAELGRNLVQRGPHEWQAGLKATKQCTETFECIAELEHSRVPRDGSQTMASAGGKWRLSDSVIVEGSAGRDIGGGREGRRRLVLYLGLQLLR